MRDLGIVQLASWGDTFISTCLPRAVREQAPGCSVTFYVSSACASAVTNNPDIDELVVLPATKAEAFAMWDDVYRQAKGRHKVVVQPWAGKRPVSEWKLIKSRERRNFIWSASRCIQELGLKFKGPAQNYIYPTAEEQQRVRELLTRLGPMPKVLMEFEAFSKQTQLTVDWLPKILRTIEKRIGQVQFLLSAGNIPGDLLKCNNVIPLNDYTLREVALLPDYCKAFFGVSSGTSNACHNQLRTKRIKWFEAVNHTDWDSRPYGEADKYVYLGKTLDGYLDLISTHL